MGAKRIINRLLLILVIFMAFQAGPGLAKETPLMAPGVDGILDRAHIFKGETKGKLWARYNLVVPDEDLLQLSREEAAALLLAAFRKAPDKGDYESAWMHLMCVSGEETVYGKVHTNPSGTPLTDLSMFEANKALLKISLKLKKDVIEKVDSFVSELIDRLKEKLNNDLDSPDKGDSGEIEL